MGKSAAKKLLFICSRNKSCSLTAEKLIYGIPGYRALEGKEVVVLHIADKYEFMAETLIDELKTRLARYVTILEDA